MARPKKVFFSVRDRSDPFFLAGHHCTSWKHKKTMPLRLKSGNKSDVCGHLGQFGGLHIPAAQQMRKRRRRRKWKVKRNGKGKGQGKGEGKQRRRGREEKRKEQEEAGSEREAGRNRKREHTERENGKAIPHLHLSHAVGWYRSARVGTCISLVFLLWWPEIQLRLLFGNLP